MFKSNIPIEIRIKVQCTSCMYKCSVKLYTLFQKLLKPQEHIIFLIVSLHLTDTVDT